jgi:hypothetical protein
MKTKFQLTIEKMLERDGNAYVTARNILNLRILSIMGIGLDDLPDTAEIADIVESIADAIEDDFDEQTIKNILSDVTFETIEELCW